jgi:alpha-tubulin suppressor-like RCC1 family protein
MLGHGSATALARPYPETPVALGPGPNGAPANLTQIALGSDFGCGIDEAGTVLCWGKNDSGKLGDGTAQSRAWAAPVTFEDGTPLTGVSAVAAGAAHACAVAAKGDVLCWGSNSAGQTGFPDGASMTPAGVLREEGGPLTGATGIWAGLTFTCAIVGDKGAVHCWGNNENGQAGGESELAIVPSARPVSRLDGGDLVDLVDVAELALGHEHACAIDTSGQSIWCWGLGSFWALAQGDDEENHSVAVAAKGLKQLIVSQIASGYQYSCVVVSSLNKVHCWGSNQDGQLGTGGTSFAEKAGPVAMGGLEVSEISAGSKVTCTIDVEGGVWCWGSGTGGLLGDGTFTTHKPTIVSGLEAPSL